MKKYQQLAEQLREQIASGIWQPGDRLPSLHDQVALSGMSFMTVSHAYQLLESQGYIIARPQSGYYVAPQAIKMPKATVIPVTRDEAVDINTYILCINRIQCVLCIYKSSNSASLLYFCDHM